MSAETRSGPRLSERLHAELRGRILDGELAPGERLPSERAIAEEHGINRHAVREALKRLEQAGLISISQGGATRVRDWRDSGGLEVLLDLVMSSQGPPPLELIRSVLEMRATIGIDAARLCAERADAEERELVSSAADSVAVAIEAGESSVDELHAELWRRIVAGSQNIAYRLALNSLVTAVDAYEEIAAVLRPSDVDGMRRLGSAVAAGEADRAGAAAERLLAPDIGALG
ncbi:FadR family transcriptional regulator [Thermoleophilia bacterium SCSIO 60948]|nr:FadR family transcriptional regulator [Thermoleophilia bacterium SCSIO 60948]